MMTKGAYCIRCRQTVGVFSDINIDVDPETGKLVMYQIIRCSKCEAEILRCINCNYWIEPPLKSGETLKDKPVGFCRKLFAEKSFRDFICEHFKSCWESDDE